MQDVKFLFSQEIVRKLKYLEENKISGFMMIKMKRAALQTDGIFIVSEKKPETIKPEKNIKKSRKFSIPIPRPKIQEKQFWERDNFLDKKSHKSKFQKNQKPSRNFRFVRNS